MDKSLLLERVLRREKKLRQARQFRPRLLADQPKTELLLPALNHARRFVRPLCKGSEQLVEGGLDSVRLDVDEKTMSAGWVISAVNRDRYGDIVIPDGCEETLSDYQRNPQVFFAHKSNEMPIGLCEKDGNFSFQVREKDILSRCYFHGSTEESDKVFDLVAKHVLRAASIGFLPIFGEIIEGSEYQQGDTEIDFDMGGLIFHKWSITEWSVVSVPANGEALRSWLCKSNVKSLFLRRSLEPFATPLKKNQLRGGFDLMKLKKSEPKPFDIRKQKLRPASLEIDFASKHIGCQVKEIVQRHVGIPGAKMGGFLSGWRNATSQIEEIDVRNLTYDGREMPPVRETIQLNSTKSDDFLLDGIVFYEKNDLKFVMSIQPTWGGLFLRLFMADKDSSVVQGLVSKAWDLAATEYNFLKGEAFSLSGSFIPKTKEKFSDIFLTETNEKSITRTLQRLNSKQMEFSNRGAIWMGPPGTGKTLSGRVIRNLADATFIWVSAKDFYNFGSFSGFQYAFELAKELAPAIIFFEDVDNSLSSFSVDFLKSEMDGIGRSTGIWTILTTNFPERLPEALIDRPGRFHDVLKFDKPNETVRKIMLVKWLPGLTNEQLTQAVKSTKGYSGAHLYELCHFAKLLREEDEEKSLSEALAEALKKIAEQQRLIKNPGGYSSEERSLGKSRIRMFRYANGRTRSGLQLLLASKNRGIKPVADELERNEDETDVVVAEEDNPDDEKACQAVVFMGGHFKTEEECQKWLEENNYSADHLIPGEEAEDPWIAVQFDAECCDPDSVDRHEIEEGIEGVYCKRVEESEEEGTDTDRYTQDGDMVDVNAHETHSAPETTVKAKAATEVTDEHLPDEHKPAEAADHDEEEAEDHEAEMPYGAHCLKSAHEHLEGLHGHIEKSLKVLEHAGVAKYLGKLQGHVEKHMGEICSVGAKHYPDHFDEASSQATDPEAADEAAEEETKSAVGEAIELMEELIHEKKLAKSQLLALRASQQKLNEIANKATSKKKQAVALSPEKLSDADIAVAEAQILKLSELIYELTGQEV